MTNLEQKLGDLEFNLRNALVDLSQAIDECDNSIEQKPLFKYYRMIDKIHDKVLDQLNNEM